MKPSFYNKLALIIILPLVFCSGIYLLTINDLTYEQVRFSVFAFALIVGYICYVVFKPSAVVEYEPAPETKIVEWKGDRYRIVTGNICTDCAFYKACHQLQDLDVANRFQHQTGTNCMMDNCYYELVETSKATDNV